MGRFARGRAHYLINAGDTTWYINANINLRETELMWMTWQATGDSYFQKQYESEWAFTMQPSQARWPGDGLHLTAVPTSADGRGGAGYLGEASTGTPGFDAEYTQAQLDIANQMYVMSRDPRWLRLMNLFYNQIASRVEVVPGPGLQWNLNATGGSRKNEKMPFSTGALYELATDGGRTELEASVVSQFQGIENTFRWAMSYTNATMYKELALQLAWPMPR